MMINKTPGTFLGATDIDRDVYQIWLREITHNYTTFPSHYDLMTPNILCNSWNYYDFMCEFGTSSGMQQYTRPSNMYLEPEAMEYINNNYCN